MNKTVEENKNLTINKNLTNTANKKTYTSMNFYLNQAIINNMVDYCIENGKIDYFLVSVLKEVFIVSEYIDSFEAINDEDETLDVQATFENIRENGHYKMFVSLYNRRDLIEFEELLDKSLKQEAMLQLEIIRKSYTTKG